MIKDALYAVTHGQDLSYDLAKYTMNKIMSGEVAEVPMAGFLCALAAKGPTVDEVTAFAEVMREKAGSVPHEGTVVEIVGTGGDEANTFNISTTSGFIKRGIFSIIIMNDPVKSITDVSMAPRRLNRL